MHVVYIITRADAIGGAAIHVRDMARSLIDHGEQATVLIGGTGEVTEELARHAVPFRSIRSLKRSIYPWHDTAALIVLIRMLNQLKPDLVSTHTAKAGWLGRMAAAACRIPVIYTPHGWSIENRIGQKSGRVFRVLERVASPLARQIVNVCNAEYALAGRYSIGFPNQHVIVHNGVLDVNRSLLANPSRMPSKILMVARFEAPKDQACLLRALANLKDDPWTMEFVGAGPELESSRRLAIRLGLEHRVNFAGSRVSIPQSLANSQLFVLASRSEGFPRSILEAMRAALPVVASDVGGVSEAVRPGETGLVVPPSDPASLAHAIRFLIQQPELRVQFGKEGRRRYAENFTFDRTFDKTFQLYLKALSIDSKFHAVIPEEVR